MKPTIGILEKVSQNSRKNKEEVFTRLYRYMLRPDIYFVAYKRLYANKGASTKGVNDDTADGFSDAKVRKIVESLANETYTPSPSRRTYIKKANGRMRPLGIPTFTDKLVQEVVRMILEAVYEPIFLDCSHGFRPNRSCHTSLDKIKHQFQGAKWFVEGDIKGCFDNINHNVLVGFIGNKIKDARFIKLIYKFLKAGYLEDWKYNNTYSGTPQGGIVSPILANIYLHELDKFAQQLKAKFDMPSVQKYTPEYDVLRRSVEKLRRRIKVAKGEKRERLISEMQLTRTKMLQTPSKSQTDKKIQYVRYADDFLMGVNGSKVDCERIKSELKSFVADVLKMELSEEKTLITHSQTSARFLGYDVSVRRNGKIKPGGRGYTKRTLNYSVDLCIPLKEKIERFLFEKSVVQQKNGRLNPIKRNGLVNLTEFEIVSTYNAELRGICNYYSLASNFGMLNYFEYLMEYSCLKTLASKRKTTISKIIRMYRNGKGGWSIPYETKGGKKQLTFARHSDCKKTKVVSDIREMALIQHLSSRTSFEDRLKAKVCELCGSTDSEFYEVHHINKVKNLSGKQAWERIMISKRRKTMVVCRQCHHAIHNQ